MSALTQATADAIVTAICSRVGAVRVRKEGSGWQALGMLFDGLRLVGAHVPSGAQVVSEYAQTLPLVPGVRTPFSTVVLEPARALAPHDLAKLFVHEGTHAQQSNADPAWAVKYLQHREYRIGTAEAPAFAAAIAYEWALTGAIPQSLATEMHLFREGYDAQDSAELGHDVIEIRATEIAHGVIRSELARLAIAITYRDQPDALDANALTLLRAHCPDALVLP